MCEKEWPGYSKDKGANPDVNLYGFWKKFYIPLNPL